jgi:hypothetical protein
MVGPIVSLLTIRGALPIVSLLTIRGRRILEPFGARGSTTVGLRFEPAR